MCERVPHSSIYAHTGTENGRGSRNYDLSGWGKTASCSKNALYRHIWAGKERVQGATMCMGAGKIGVSETTRYFGGSALGVPGIGHLWAYVGGANGSIGNNGRCEPVKRGVSEATRYVGDTRH